jgi:hypothetical protein
MCRTGTSRCERSSGKNADNSGTSPATMPWYRTGNASADGDSQDTEPGYVFEAACSFHSVASMWLNFTTAAGVEVVESSRGAVRFTAVVAAA